MTDPEAAEAAKDVRFICTECGELVEVSDIEQFVRAVHIQNACLATEQLFPR